MFWQIHLCFSIQWILHKNFSDIEKQFRHKNWVFSKFAISCLNNYYLSNLKPIITFCCFNEILELTPKYSRINNYMLFEHDTHIYLSKSHLMIGASYRLAQIEFLSIFYNRKIFKLNPSNREWYIDFTEWNMKLPVIFIAVQKIIRHLVYPINFHFLYFDRLSQKSAKWSLIDLPLRQLFIKLRPSNWLYK